MSMRLAKNQEAPSDGDVERLVKKSNDKKLVPVKDEPIMVEPHSHGKQVSLACLEVASHRRLRTGFSLLILVICRRSTFKDPYRRRRWWLSRNSH